VLEVRFESPEGALPPLPPDGEVALYRTLQEALANAVRHAEAGRVEARLEVEKAGVGLSVEDDGTGFSDDAARRLRSRGGLAGIRERIVALGGEFEMGNSQSGGARVRVFVPTDRGAADRE
jgi:two-component system, NarL family, sensor histidine kinase DegS